MDTTKKIPAITQMNEKQYAEKRYNEAMINMISQPTEENRKEFENANKYFFEVSDAYRIGARLLAERARRLANALFGREDFI